MEQIYMIEVFVKKIILKLEPYVKDEWEIQQEEEEKRREEERLAALEALKKGKGKPPKPKPPPKGGKKGPAGPSEEELKFMQTCSVQMNCLPLFEFIVAHDNFIAPPPPPPPPKKGKPAKAPKKGKATVMKRALPSEPLPQPPYFGVGNAMVFVCRPSKLTEILRSTPLRVTIWNRDEKMDCIGFTNVDWHESFFECIKKSEEYNPVNLDVGKFRDTTKTRMASNTIEYTRPLQCEAELIPSGEVEFYIRLTCLGNKVLTYFIQLPEMDRLPGRKYLVDDYKTKDLEVVRHWEGTFIEDLPPVAYFYGAPDIMREPIKAKEQEEEKKFDDYIVAYTNSELAILGMGFPKGPCGGINCPKRMDYRGSQHEFIPGQYIKVGKDERKYQHGQFVNKRDVHGPCGRLDCPLAKKVRAYICNEGAYKTCKKPCPKDYY